MLKILVVTLVAIGALTTLFRKEYKKELRLDFKTISVSSTIESIYYFKDDISSGLATNIKGIDTQFCFTGHDKERNILYGEIAKEGDSIFKQKGDSSFSIIHNDTAFRFDIMECKNR